MTRAPSSLLAAGPLTGLGHALGQPFIQHALLAGSTIALFSGLVGYFVVLRGQVFAGDALSHVAYAGALAALAAGLDLRLGLFAGTVLVGLLLGGLGGRTAVDDVVIGTVFSWVLGLGVFFLAVYTTRAATGNSTANTNVLFGSIFGISGPAAVVAAAVAIGGTAVLLLIARPLLFASLDPAVAAARGVPVRLLGPVFLGLAGVAAAEASQAIGALLLFGLLAAPPATAQLLTSRPWVALPLSGALAVAVTWIGIAIAYAAPAVPVSFAIMATAAAGYAAAAARSAIRGRAGRSPAPDGSTGHGPAVTAG